MIKMVGTAYAVQIYTTARLTTAITVRYTKNVATADAERRHITQSINSASTNVCLIDKYTIFVGEESSSVQNINALKM